jgi:hypothetical protein
MAWLGWALMFRQAGASIPEAVSAADAVTEMLAGAEHE